MKYYMEYYHGVKNLIRLSKDEYGEVAAEMYVSDGDRWSLIRGINCNKLKEISVNRFKFYQAIMSWPHYPWGYTGDADMYVLRREDDHALSGGMKRYLLPTDHPYYKGCCRGVT